VEYLTNIPQSISEYGLCKTLLVRREVIHIKHIFTEIFIRRKIDIEKYLNLLEMSLFDYMEYMTNRLRLVHHFSREYINKPDAIVKCRDRFFPNLKLYRGLNVVIALDFDGVVTEKSFKPLYELCLLRNKTIICSANPTITEDWFTKREYSLPNKIYANKGKIKKIRQLIELNKKYDYVFYADNEKEYLEFAWLFGLQTYIYENNTIKYFTLKTK